jgi:hypothetical protein
MTVKLFSQIEQYVAALPPLPAEDRREALDALARFLRAKVAAGEVPDVIFICTHNSRRSHFGQAWAQALAGHFGLPLRAFSGGTEATACNPRTIRALEQAGFRAEQLDESPNPRYHIRFGEGGEGIEAWSKVYSDPANPRSGFGAVMTCDSANEACPVVLGAAARFPILYEDPKRFDGSPEEGTAYAERCLQIASELMYVMRQAAAR